MQPLTPMEFRGLVKARGYTLREAAQILGITAGRLSQVASDIARAPYYDLAVWALAPKRSAAAVEAKRARTLAKIQAEEGRGPRSVTTDIWNELLVVGSIFMVRDEQGDHLPAGAEGTVESVSSVRGERCIDMRFQTGYRETYTLSFLRSPECFMAATGRTRWSKMDKILER